MRALPAIRDTSTTTATWRLNVRPLYATILPLGMKAEALLLLRAIGDRETATGLLGVGDLIEATGLDPEIVVNELERLLRSGYVSGKLQKTFSGGDPRPWFVVNPLLSERGSNVLEQSTS